MVEPFCPDLLVYICNNCLPHEGVLPRQWERDGVQVLVKEVPCSGKIDGQYIFHALEGGVRGLCIVACPEGECRRAQGNYRALIRIRTVKRLLDEIGFDPEQVALINFSSEDSVERLTELVEVQVKRLSARGESPSGVKK